MGLALAIVNGRILRSDGTMAKGGLLIGADGRIKRLLPTGLPEALEWDNPIWNAGGMLILPGIIDSYGSDLSPHSPIRPRDHSLKAEIDHFKASDLRARAAGVSTTSYRLDCTQEDGPFGITQATRWIAAFALCQSELKCRSTLHLHYSLLPAAAHQQVLGWLGNKSVSALWLSLTDDARSEEQEQLLTTAFYARQNGIAVGAMNARAPAHWRALHDHGGSLCAFPAHTSVARLARTLGDEVLLCASALLRAFPGEPAPSPLPPPEPARTVPFVGCTPLAPLSAIAHGLGTILVSAGRPEALLPSVFRLAEQGVAYLTDAWGLLSAHPARAFGLSQQGSLAPGQLADVLVIKPACPRTGSAPSLRASFIGGACVYRAARDPKPILRPVHPDHFYPQPEEH